MAGKLQEEIRQTRPMRLLEEETVLNILRTGEVLSQKLALLLKPYDLSPTQYNVLRILRGAGPGGLTCKDISGRMVTREPDITRLLDRLEKRGLITRDRASGDRRYVTVRLTAAGLELVNNLDGPVDIQHRRTLAHVSEEQQKQLIETLESVRSGE